MHCYLAALALLALALRYNQSEVNIENGWRFLNSMIIGVQPLCNRDLNDSETECPPCLHRLPRVLACQRVAAADFDQRGDGQ